jgi:predicted transposase/invertase (TIGR01784 family)
MRLAYQEHDKFFKQSLKERQIALDFFRAHLPDVIYQKLDLNTLQAIDKSYLTPEGQEIQSDIIFTCQLAGNPAYIPILFLVEHQSTSDEQMAFRLLQYTVGLMADHLKAGGKQLPLVLPLCVYHGKRSPYPYSTDIYDSFADPHLARQLVFRPFQLIDLTVLSEETLQQHGTVALMELLLKTTWKKTFLTLLQRLLDEGLLQQVIDHTTASYLTAVLEYALNQSSRKQNQTADDIIGLFLKALPEKREDIMTFADQLRQQGMQQGMQKGMQKGMQQGMHIAAKKMLAEGMNIAIIEKITGLSDVDLALLAAEDK